MSQSYEIEWVGNQTREWSGQHGSFRDYRVALQGYDAAKTVVLTQKPETPAPKVGDSLYGYVKVDDVTPQNGEPFTVHKFKKEQRPDTESRRQPASASNGKDDEFWAAKDRRIARAGMMQAVVTASDHLKYVANYGLASYVEHVNQITDALLASLDEKVPSPNGSMEVDGLRNVVASTTVGGGSSVDEIQQVAEQAGLEVESDSVFDDEDIPF